MLKVGSVRGRARSLLRLPMTLSPIRFESTAEMGRLTASLILLAQPLKQHRGLRIATFADQRGIHL